MDWIDKIVALTAFFVVYLAGLKHLNELRDKLLAGDHVGEDPRKGPPTERQVHAWLSDWGAIHFGALISLLFFAIFTGCVVCSALDQSWPALIAAGLILVSAVAVLLIHFFSMKQDARLLWRAHPARCRQTSIGLRVESFEQGQDENPIAPRSSTTGPK